jgi:hypothetical protein
MLLFSTYCSKVYVCTVVVEVSQLCQDQDGAVSMPSGLNMNMFALFTQ